VEKLLEGRSILIVEDDSVLATDLASLLTGAGCRVVLPTTSVAAALSTLVHYAIDAAVLDVNIQNEWVFPVAHALAAAGVPFLFLTAYALDSIPAEHRGRPFLRKPHVPEALLATIEAMAISPRDRPQAANDEASKAGPKTA
jgi:DNA-binding response OmpR family regulator